VLNLLGHTIDEDILLKAYSISFDVLEEVFHEFYVDAAEKYPEIDILFEGVNEKNFIDESVVFLNNIKDNIESNEYLLSALIEQGQLHQECGSRSEYYQILIPILDKSFKKVIGRKWTKSISLEWVKFLNVLSEIVEATYDSGGIEQNLSAVVDEGEYPVLKLQSIQDISKSQALKNDILSLINDNDGIIIDASEVEKIDGTALQLLSALFIYSTSNNLMLSWSNPTDKLIISAEMLGVKELLKLHS